MIKKIAPTIFWPIPRVQSALISMQRKSRLLTAAEFKALSSLVKFSFSQRRKKLFPLLCTKWDRQALLQIFITLTLNIDSRPERISVDQYIALSNLLGPNLFRF